MTLLLRDLKKRTHTYDLTFLDRKMEAMQQALKQEASIASKRRAVGEAGGEDQYRKLAVATAKTVVGLDVNMRRLQGCLETTALALEGHPYLQGLQEVGKAYDSERKTYKEQKNYDAMSAMTPTHERCWISLIAQIAKDESVPKEKKVNLLAYSETCKSVTGQILTCMQKKCHRQKQWTEDRWRINLMVVPELRTIQMEAMAAIAMKPKVEVKMGAPSRNPNVRSVVSTLVEMGEYTAPNQEA